MNTQLRCLSLIVALTTATCMAVADDHTPQRHGRKLSNAEHANDVATSMVVDQDGNVYTTGYSKGKGTGYDFLTIKYDAGGNEIWAERLDGGASGDDKPVAVKVDISGNVFVTGSSENGASNADYLTVKYNHDGKLVWRQRYNGSGNGFDSPTSMAVDEIGNVCVTGFSLSKGTGYDCVTLSYAPDGRQRWVSVYNGPDNEDDFGTAVSLDAAGDCFVTGYSNSKANGASYLTMKFDRTGHGAWVRNFAIGSTHMAKATALVADATGGVCVTGYSQGSHPSYDYVTIRYDGDGKALWSRRFDGSGHGDDKPASIAVDSNGCYVVTGESLGSETGNDFLTLKYSPEGSVLWQQRLDGSGLSDSASSMVLDRDGAILITGRSVGSNSGSDFLTAKYDASGKILWTSHYNGDANDVDRPVSVGVDHAGNVYVAGYSWGGKESGFDFVTIKYSPNGAQIWVRRYNGPGSLQ